MPSRRAPPAQGGAARPPGSCCAAGGAGSGSVCAEGRPHRRQSPHVATLHLQHHLPPAPCPRHASAASTRTASRRNPARCLGINRNPLRPPPQAICGMSTASAMRKSMFQLSCRLCTDKEIGADDAFFQHHPAPRKLRPAPGPHSTSPHRHAYRRLIASHPKAAMRHTAPALAPPPPSLPSGRPTQAAHKRCSFRPLQCAPDLAGWVLAT